MMSSSADPARAADGSPLPDDSVDFGTVAIQ